MSSKKVEQNGQGRRSQVIRDSWVPAVSELIAQAKQDSMTKEQLISALEQLTADLEKNPPSDSNESVQRSIVLNSIEWWRTDLFIRLLQHDTLDKYIDSLGGTNAVIFLFEPSTARFHLERGEHIPEQWRVASLHTREYPKHKIDDWKKEPVNTNDPTNRLQHTGYRLYLRNRRLLSELDLLLEKVRESQDQMKITPEQLSQSPDFFGLRAAFQISHFREFSLLAEAWSEVRGNDLMELLVELENLEPNGPRTSRFTTFIRLLGRLRLDSSFTSLFATWRSSNLNSYRYITTYELSVLFLYHDCWRLLLNLRPAGEGQRAIDPRRLAIEFARHLEVEQKKYVNDREKDFSLKTYIETSLNKLLIIDTPHPVSTEEIVDALKMSLMFIPRLEEYAKSLYKQQLGKDVISAKDEVIQDKIIEFARPILNDLEKIYRQFSMLIRSKIPSPETYTKLLEIVTATITDGISDKSFLFNEAALEAFEGSMPLKMKTVLNTGGIVDRLVMPIVLAEDLYGLLVMDIDPQAHEPDKVAIENLLSKLALSITLYDKVKTQAQQFVRDVFIRVMRHELRNFSEVINNLPKLGIDAQELSKEVSERRKPMELTLKCYSLIWSRQKFAEISSTEVCRSISGAFQWRGYSVQILNDIPQSTLSEVLIAVTAELLRNAYKCGKSVPLSSFVHVYAREEFTFVVVKNNGRMSPKMINYLNNRDLTTTPEKDFGSWACTWLVKNYLNEGQIEWSSDGTEVQVTIRFLRTS